MTIKQRTPSSIDMMNQFEKLLEFKFGRSQSVRRWLNPVIANVTESLSIVQIEYNCLQYIKIQEL